MSIYPAIFEVALGDSCIRIFDTIAEATTTIQPNVIVYIFLLKIQILGVFKTMSMSMLLYYFWEQL